MAAAPSHWQNIIDTDFSYSSEGSLAGGPDYMFSGNAWEPQLTINTNVGYAVNSEVNKIRFQLKFADIAELRSSMKS